MEPIIENILTVGKSKDPIKKSHWRYLGLAESGSRLIGLW
jgi:hypothetical protein